MSKIEESDEIATNIIKIIKRQRNVDYEVWEYKGLHPWSTLVNSHNDSWWDNEG